MGSDERIAITPRLVVGICITLVGSLLMLDRMGILDTQGILRFWPAAVIAVGAVMVAQASDGSGTTRGWVLVFVGSWLLFGTLGAMRLRPWEFIWPTILILIGTNLVMQTIRRGQQTVKGDTSGQFSLFAVMGGAARRWDGSAFRGGEMTAFMGGCELDLRQAHMEPGEEAVIDLFTVMGGHSIKVPSTWTVVCKATPFMGGIDDETKPPSTPLSPKLVLRGFIMMGGVELKN
jgi:hypothetical protein